MIHNKEKYVKSMDYGKKKEDRKKKSSDLQEKKQDHEECKTTEMMGQ